MTVLANPKDLHAGGVQDSRGQQKAAVLYAGCRACLLSWFLHSTHDLHFSNLTNKHVPQLPCRQSVHHSGPANMHYQWTSMHFPCITLGQQSAEFSV